MGCCAWSGGGYRAIGFGLIFAMAAAHGPWAQPCCTAAVTLSSAKLTEAQKPLMRALLSYYEALNRKDFTELKDLLDPKRTSDTSPGPSFGYRSLLTWRRFRIYAIEVVKVETDLNQITVKEGVEAEAYNGAFFLYGSPAVYTFRSDGGRFVMTARGASSVDRAKTRDPFDMLYLYRDTLYRGDFPGSIEYLDKFLALKPEDPYGVAMKGAALVQKGEYTNALKLLEWVTGLPEPMRRFCSLFGEQAFEAQVHDSIGACNIALKNFDAARRALERSRLLNPRYVPAYLHLAELELASGRPDEAKIWYSKAYSILPDVPQAEVALFGNPAYGNNRTGMAFLKEERLEDAAVMFLQASRENPAYDKPYNNLGLVREKEGKEAEAIALYRKALDLNPKNSAILINLANLYLKKGDRRTAMDTVRKVLDQDPESLAALNLKERASGKGGSEKGQAEKN